MYYKMFYFPELEKILKEKIKLIKKREYQRIYYKNNKKKHIERVQKTCKVYKEKNKDKINAYYRIYHSTDEYKAKRRAHYQKNKEKIREQHKLRYHATKKPKKKNTSK